MLTMRAPVVARICGAGARLMLILAVVLAPLPYGSVTPFWVVTFVIALSLSVFLLIFLAGNGQLGPLFVTTTMALGVISFIGAGTICTAGLEFPIWQVPSTSGVTTRQHLAAQLDAAPSIGIALIVCLSFAAGYLDTRRRGSAWHLVRAIACAGIAYAVLGLLVQSLMPGHVLFEEKISYRNVFTGTFVNRNTAASYFGLACLCATGLLVRSVRREGRPFDLGSWAIFMTRLVSSQTGFWCLAVFLTLFVTVQTGSRAGTAALFIGLSIFAIILFFRRLQQVPTRVSAILVALSSIIFVIFALGQSDLLSRLRLDLFTDQRWFVWTAVVQAIGRSPWFGYGAGSFEVVFPALRTAELGLDGIWIRAHSTPLQLAFELGLPVTFAILCQWLAIGFSLLRASCRSGSQYMLPTLALVAFVQVSLHGAVDFSIQVAGFAIPFFALIGAALGQADYRMQNT